MEAVISPGRCRLPASSRSQTALSVALLDNLLEVVGGGGGELVRPQPDRLLDCRVGGVEDQRPHANSLDAIVVPVRQGHGQDVPFAIEGLVDQLGLLFAGGQGIPRWGGRTGLQFLGHGLVLSHHSSGRRALSAT